MMTTPTTTKTSNMKMKALSLKQPQQLTTTFLLFVLLVFVGIVTCNSESTTITTTTTTTTSSNFVFDDEITVPKRKNSSTSTSRTRVLQSNITVLPSNVLLNSTDYTSLLEGTVVTRTNVNKFANLARDLRDIRAATLGAVSTSSSSSNVIQERIRGIYYEGLYSEITPGRRFALKYLNDDLVHTVDIDNSITSSGPKPDSSLLLSSYTSPIYLFQLYGLNEHRSASSTSSTTTNTGSATLSHDIRFVANYAFTSITQMITNHVTLVPDAILINSFWMYATHTLFHGLVMCRQHSLQNEYTTTTTTSSSSNTNTNNYGFDEFIALWIGFEQNFGSSTIGHSLYRWTQEIGILFQTAIETTEARVNTKIKLLYQEASIALAYPNACKQQEESVNTEGDGTEGNNKDMSTPSVVEKQLWYVIVRIIQQMMIPLYQYTFYHLIEENTVELQLYAKALLPQLSRCQPVTYKRLYRMILPSDGSSTIDYTLRDVMISDLVETYTKCFGLSCRDIGTYQDGSIIRCNDEDIYYEDNTPPQLAGYVASTDIRNIAKFDLDIHQMKLLLQLVDTSVSYHHNYVYAQYIYQLGYNVPIEQDSYNDPFELLSLRKLATLQVPNSSESMTMNQYYSSYIDYYNDHLHMDKELIRSFDPTIIGTSHPNGLTSDERAILVHYTLATQVLFVHIVTLLENTILQCQKDNVDYLDGDMDSITLFDLTHPLDEVGALLIGSMEGSQFGGTDDLDIETNLLLYGFANVRSFQFQTLNHDKNGAKSNEEIVHLLYSIKGEILALDCMDVERSIQKLIGYIQIGIIQSILYVSVIVSEMQKKATSENTILGSDLYYNTLLIQGHALVSSLLPLVRDYDPELAVLLTENLSVTYTPTTSTSSTGTDISNTGEQIQYIVTMPRLQDGAQLIADILSEYAYETLNIPCKSLGTYGGINPCLKGTIVGSHLSSSYRTNNYNSKRTNLSMILHVAVIVITTTLVTMKFM